MHTPRAHVFSLFLGLLFIGVGAGPTLGGILIHVTGSVLSVFYLATATHLIYAALIIFVIPESLSKRRMLAARRTWHEQLEEERLSPKAHGFGARFRSVFRFLHPLAIFYPDRVRNSANPLKRGRRDWNLLLVALAYGFTISVISSSPYKFQYTSVVFGWSSEQVRVLSCKLTRHQLTRQADRLLAEYRRCHSRGVPDGRPAA